MPKDLGLDQHIVAGRTTLDKLQGTSSRPHTGWRTDFNQAASDLDIAFVYGEILSRPGLDLRVRQACTVAALLVNGSVQSHLRFHMEGLLNAGGSVEDLVELLTMSAALLGFPTAIDGMAVLKEIVADRGGDYTPVTSPVPRSDRFERGAETLRAMLRTDASTYTRHFAATSPDLASWTVEFEFGDVLARGRLAPLITHLAAIMMLAASGNRTDQLRLHIAGALAGAVSVSELQEALTQLAAFAGFPTALNAMSVAAAVIADQPTEYSVNASPPRTSTDDGDRHSRGMATIAATSGAGGDKVVHGFDQLAPHLGEMTVDFVYGHVFSRRGLDLKTRELIALATSVGNMTHAAEEPFRVHIAAALNVGASRDEIMEALLHVAPYRGLPAVQRAIAVAELVFEQRVTNDR